MAAASGALREALRVRRRAARADNDRIQPVIPSGADAIVDAGAGQDRPSLRRHRLNAARPAGTSLRAVGRLHRLGCTLITKERASMSKQNGFQRFNGTAGYIASGPLVAMG